jgi:hypothetical protein
VNDLEAKRIAQLKEEAAAARATSAAMLNMVRSYKVQAAVFAAMNAGRGPSSSRSGFTPGTSPGTPQEEKPIILMLDGEVVARSVVRRGKRGASARGLTSNRWYEGLS